MCVEDSSSFTTVRNIASKIRNLTKWFASGVLCFESNWVQIPFDCVVRSANEQRRVVKSIPKVEFACKLPCTFNILYECQVRRTDFHHQSQTRYTVRLINNNNDNNKTNLQYSVCTEPFFVVNFPHDSDFASTSVITARPPRPWRPPRASVSVQVGPYEQEGRTRYRWRRLSFKSSESLNLARGSG